jgi:hypothetical protein
LLEWKRTKKNGRTVTQHVLEKNVLKQQVCKERNKPKSEWWETTEMEREGKRYMRDGSSENMKHDDV